jgi:hypothetical protein
MVRTDTILNKTSEAFETSEVWIIDLAQHATYPATAAI